MRKAFPLLTFLLLLLPCHGNAQTWSAEQQEILDHVKMCWTAWSETVNAKDLTPWLEGCQPSEDIQAWSTSGGVLWNLDFQSREFPEWVKSVRRYWWQTVQPLDIKVYDDTALIWFFATFAVEDTSGTVTRIQQKRFEVMQRYDGGWHWVGAMVYPEEVGSSVRVIR